MNRGLEFIREWNLSHSSQPSYDDAIQWADEHPKSPWIKCSERMPEEKLYEEDTLRGPRKWTESEQVLVCTSNNTYHTEWTHNGHWPSSQFKGIGGDSYEIIAWMPIPKFEGE